MFFDAHCHTNAYTNPKELIEYCKDNGIEVISVSNDLQSYNYCKNRGIQNLAIGIHPDNATSNRKKDLDDLETEIKNKNCPIIGEIGLDYSQKNKYFKDNQKEILKKILRIAEEYKVPVNIHSYRAVNDVLEILSSYKNFPVLLHWFTGSSSQLKRAIDRNYFLGVTPSIFKSKKVKNNIFEIPMDNILTESDSPVNNWTPLDIPKVVNKISEIKKVETDKTSNMIYNNFRRYLKQ